MSSQYGVKSIFDFSIKSHAKVQYALKYLLSGICFLSGVMSLHVKYKSQDP